MSLATLRARPTYAVALLGLLTACLTACGSSESAAPSAQGGLSTSELSALASSKFDPAYTGHEAAYFKPLAEPEVKPGVPFKVGYLSESAGQPILVAMAKAAEAQVEKMGGTMITKDAGLDPQKQASQLDELISQKVNVIVGDPVVATALAPGIAKAKAAGIPFVQVDGPADQTKPLVAGAVTSVSHAFDYITWRTLKALAAEHPGGSFAVMGLALPVEPLIYLCDRMKYWGEEFGLKFVGQVDATGDTPAGYGPAANAILTKHPDVDMILTYNDASLVAAATTVASSGKKASVSTPNGGEAITQQALKAGRADLAYRVPWEETGKQAAIAAYDIVSNQNLPLPKFVDLAGPVLSKTTADQVSWIK